MVINKVSKAWSNVFDPTNPIFKLAWTQIVNSIQGSWGVGSFDVANGTGHWNRSSNLFSFRIHVTITTYGSYSFTLPWIPKENYAVLVSNGTSIKLGNENTNILSLILNAGTYTIEGHNIIV